MPLGTSPRAWFNAVHWHLRGVFATEANRRLGFSVRGLWQPAEIEARRGLAQVLACEQQRELVIDRERGYHVFPDSSLPDVTEVCDIGRSVLEKTRSEEGQHPGDKKFFQFRLAREEQRLALLRVALDRRLIATVASYLGVLPVITEADYFCSLPVAGPFTKSQLWHCDDDAGDVLKIFIYCDDVTETDGPFELVEAGPSRRARNLVGYRYAGRRYRVSDEVMDACVPKQQQISLLGPRGTAFIVDTVRCFHRGSRIVDSDRYRIAAMICYCPPNGLTLPRRLAHGNAPLASFASSFSDPLERAVLGAPVATRWV